MSAVADSLKDYRILFQTVLNQGTSRRPRSAYELGQERTDVLAILLVYFPLTKLGNNGELLGKSAWLIFLNLM